MRSASVIFSTAAWERAPSGLDPAEREGADYRRSEHALHRREFLRQSRAYDRAKSASPFERQLHSEKLRRLADEIEGLGGAHTSIGSVVAREFNSEPELLSLKMLHIERTWNEHNWPEFGSRARSRVQWFRSMAEILSPSGKSEEPPL
jgi:hypothetical protein